MAFTQHGHHIEGTTYNRADRPKSVARCGGPGMCAVCSGESARYREQHGFVDMPTSAVMDQEAEKRDLIFDLSYVLEEFDRQVEELEVVATKLGCTKYQIRTTTGDFMYAQLLIARAQVLAALAHLT